MGQKSGEGKRDSGKSGKEDKVALENIGNPDKSRNGSRMSDQHATSIEIS